MSDPTATEPPPSAPPRRLTRSTSDRMVAGVCGGLAEYTGIDPVVFRVVAVVAALMGGSGLLAYLIAWIVIPESTSERSHAETFLHDRKLPKAAAIALGVLVVLVLGSMIDGQFGRPHLGGGGFGLVLLVGFAVWLWIRSERTTSAPPPMPPGALPPAASGVAGAPPPPAEPSRLFGLTFSAALLTAGVLAGVHASGAADLDIEHVLAACLVVVGAGLVAGAWVGRARGLIVIGIPLALLTAVATAADVPVRGGIGEREWRPRTVSQLRPEYHLGVGELRLDLDALDLDGATRRVEATVGIGHLVVWLPDDVEVIIDDADTGMGEAVLPEVTHRFPAEDGGRLILDLRVGIGSLEVRP